MMHDALRESLTPSWKTLSFQILVLSTDMDRGSKLASLGVQGVYRGPLGLNFFPVDVLD
jgi:hypothetical protein